MRQQDYENIVRCIQFGAPALAEELNMALANVVENSNNFLQHQKKLAYEAQLEQEAKLKAEAVKAAEESKAKDVKPSSK